jgi:manganese oxidase
MLGHKKTLACLSSNIVLALVLLLTAGPATAQTKPALSVAPSSSTTPLEQPAPLATRNALAAPTPAAITAAPSSVTSSNPTKTPVASQSAEPSTEPTAVSTTAASPAASTSMTAQQVAPIPCLKGQNIVKASVVAFSQPYMLNRLGAAMPNAQIFALENDVDMKQLQLKSYKRARPIVLRANVGDCLQITLTNAIYQYPALPAQGGRNSSFPILGSSQMSVHVQGMNLVDSIASDGSFVGTNASSLANSPQCGTPGNLTPCVNTPGQQPPTPVKAGESKTYTLYAQQEGTFLLYSLGDANTTGQAIDYLMIGQIAAGLIGAVNIQPKGAQWYRSQVTASDMQLATFNAKRLPGGVKLDCPPTEIVPAQCKLTIEAGPVVTTATVKKMADGYLYSMDNHPIINYEAVYPDGSTRSDGTKIPSNTPILKMLDDDNNLVSSDLTALITGPSHGRFPGTTGIDKPEPPCSLANDPNNMVKVDSLFCANPTLPDRKLPYRELTIMYHEVSNAAQAFKVFETDSPLAATSQAGMDAFAINYGTGGIGAEIYANRIGVGPMANCVDCKYEEFFLSSWTVGDPATIVDVPANVTLPAPTPPQPPQPCNPQTIANGTCTSAPAPMDPPKGPKATMVYYPDDPSNIYHSYLNDHVKFRILHGGNGVTHVHHQHAEQWLQSPNSDKSTYLDSQIITPGASYTLEMVYDGSGNLNKTAGDSLFHCHFYPHFAAGMWGGWRIHDVFEAGTILENGRVSRTGWNRALPDGEIASGVPIPAVVPLPTLAMAPVPARVKICQVDSTYDPTKQSFGNDCPPLVAGAKPIGYAAVVNQDDLNNGMYPGYPFFIPAVAGTRAPHPPMDFAPETDTAGNPLPGKYLDGGLPRHLTLGGTVINEVHTNYDWSKDFYINCQEGQNNQFIAACKNQQNQKLGYLNAVQLPEEGTTVERFAMKFNSTRNQKSFTPEGVPGNFLTNGLPRKRSDGYEAQNEFGSQLGAPFADPGIDLKGNVAGGKLPRRYKAAVFQLDVTLNRNPTTPASPRPTGWHFPQQRILSLWEDVIPTSNFVNDPTNTSIPKRQPEPLFFRANSGEVIEVWHTNLVPNYYKVDDFQVRTPTDILGQHIHLVKFDVQASDGAANGYNYEDGTFSPTEVQEIVHAINNTGGTWNGNPNAGLKLKAPPSGIIDCTKPANKARCEVWAGAQTTVQRWYADPVLDDSGRDRTLGTVFTHDHYGPSTHQQAGLYAGLLVEPAGARWRNSETGTIMGGAGIAPLRPDGGPTSWKADVLAGNQDADSFREFALEFQDFQLAYSRSVGGTGPVIPSPDPSVGYRNINAANRVNPPPTPQLVSSGATVGTFSINYRNEPVPWRVGQFGDLSESFNSKKYASTLPAMGDPTTPLLRAYQNDRVEIRTLVGAHQLAHFFNLRGLRWLWEADWGDSGFRSSMGMGLSEHTEMKFKAPYSSAQTINPCPDSTSGPCSFADYLYVASSGDNGITNGMWGLFRAYSPNKVAKNLQPLPNNPVTATSPVDYATCPAGAPFKNFDLTAIDVQNGLSEGAITLNDRGQGTGPANKLTNTLGLMYVFTADLDGGKLKAGAPREPLILRAAAGDCINVTLRNGIKPSAQVLQQKYALQAPFNQPAVAGDPATALQLKPSREVGLHPQLLSYDAATSNGINIGYNTKNQVATVGGAPAQYQWYAGTIERDQTGKLQYTPVEFGSLNLMPSDPLLQHINGLYGAMVIEPAGVDDTKITCDGKDANGNPIQVSCGPLVDTTTTVLSRASANITVPGGKPFREFVVMMTEDLKVGNASGQSTISAINYRTEPTYYRFGNPNPDTFNTTNGDNHCSLANGLVNADPQTPIYTARQGEQVRFRMLHPPGTGIVQVFSLHGHVWQRNPYAAGSTQIGDNKLSQWMGSLDNLGATAHYDLVINQAGGPAGILGDYLYSAFVPAKAEYGMWGIFRVLNANGNPVAPTPGQPVTVCVPATPTTTPVTTPPPPGKDRLERFRIKPATIDTKAQ